MKRERSMDRVLGLRSGCRFERLEDRAMLSATMEPPEFGHGMNSPPPQETPHFASAGMYAPSQDFYSAPSTATELGSPMSSSSFGAVCDVPGAMLEPQSGTSQISSGYPTSNSWANFEGQPDPSYSQLSQPAQQTQTTYYIVFFTSSTPSFAGGHLPPPNVTIVQSPYKALAMTAPPSETSDPPPNTGGQSLPKTLPIMAPPDPPGPNSGRAPGATSNDAPRGGSFTALNSASINSAALSIPSATQIATRDVDAAALSPSTALDAAFQSYAARLLLTTSTSAKEYSLKALDGDATMRDDADGDFIQLSDASIYNDELASTDAIERERAAVDKVLRGLEELDTLPADSIAAGDAGNEAGAIDEADFDSLGEPFGFAPIVDSEGGMVMLRASDGANDGAFNLLSAGDANVDVLGFRVGVEASVGFYQAVDVATDDSPVPIDVPTTSPVAEPVRQVERDKRASTDGEGGASPKAAAAIGATSLIGAMLWVSQRPRKNHAQPADSYDERPRRKRIS